MWNLFHHVDYVSSERPQAEKVGAWRQRGGAVQHPLDIIVEYRIIHNVGWDRNPFVLTRTVDALKEETS